MNSTQYIGMDVHQESIFDCGQECCWKARDGMCHRDESQHDSAVFDGLLETCASRLKKEPGLLCNLFSRWQTPD